MTAADSHAFKDLLAAYERVSADPAGESAAYVSRATQVGSTGLATQSKQKSLCLTIWKTEHSTLTFRTNKPLALRFVNDQLPTRYREASEFFRHPGAYREFKAMLERARKLEEWYAYESEAVASALRAWVIENELPIPLPSQPGEA